MFYALLIVVFVAVFGFIAWRVVAGYRLKGQAPTPPPVTYECPVCNETECDCYKKSDPHD
jgi:hypothetical protein